MHLKYMFSVNKDYKINRFFSIIDPKLGKKLESIFGLNENSSLAQLLDLLSLFPYENFTKIIKKGNVIRIEDALRSPDEVIRDFLNSNTGGTCFSLTATFIALLAQIGIVAYPILADRHYGINTHCALFFEYEKKLKLLDPGFLIYSPVTLPVDNPLIIKHDFNRLELRPQESGRKVELRTISGSNKKYRLTYKISPISRENFLQAWKDSFSWEMMTYPIFSRYHEQSHYYLQKDLLRIKGSNQRKKIKLTAIRNPEDLDRIYGINEKIYYRALNTIKHG